MPASVMRRIKINLKPLDGNECSLQHRREGDAECAEEDGQIGDLFRLCEDGCAACQVLAKEAVSYLRRDRRYLSQREQQQCMDKAAREICCNRSAEVDLVFFGNGSLRHSRVHAPVSTKGFARAFGRIKPTIIIDEYKTSSWCPQCESKLHCRTSSQSESSVPTMPLQGNYVEQLISEDTPDNRMECCSECGSEFPHDVVSIENFLQIALALLKGECRPAYLT